MIDNYLAHSARDGYQAQSYTEHINNVVSSATQYANDIGDNYQDPGQFLNIIRHAAEYHDLGKLEAQNQQALHSDAKSAHLPINHVDAGTGFLLSESDESLYSALTVFSHHRGLPNIVEEQERSSNAFRDANPLVRTLTDASLPGLLQTHRQCFPSTASHTPEVPSGDPGILFRMVLSCLADADHSDTASVYGNQPSGGSCPSLRPKERLAALNRYISNFTGTDSRSQLRSQMFNACRDSQTSEPIVSCSSPVGSGKTTAIMAHLLTYAERTNARHIFVVLPFTNIISQSVSVYRQALCLPGESPKAVVAELHHRADFENEDIRYLTALWRAPIIVTTAVAFFETLASNKPAALRRLHELPGSVIFVDEAHAALPIHLIPLTWKWMQLYADEWKCHWVLASGSLVKFWDIPEISSTKRNIPELVPAQLRDKLDGYEKNRIHIDRILHPLSRKELISRVFAEAGPRIVIMNTVQSAAVLANDICKQYGKEHVLHLSTALSPHDRDLVIEKIKFRLQDKQDDSNWVLVATSCVEAGVDFSFRTGFRESASILSLLQASGRVNRNGSAKDAHMFCFTMQDDPMLKHNPAVKNAAAVLNRYFDNEIDIQPAICTEVIRAELLEYGQRNTTLLQAEDDLAFDTVASEYQVIESDTVLAVVNRNVAAQIIRGGCNWESLQKHAVSIRRYYTRKWMLREIKKGIYEWTLPYDSFLGYMKGVISQLTAEDDFLCL